LSNEQQLDELAEMMAREAASLQAGGVQAQAIVRSHAEVMLQQARSVALGSPTPAELTALRAELHRTARQMAWQLAGAGNTQSWAFGEIVAAIRAAERTSAPLLALAGVQAVPVDRDALAAAVQALDTYFTRFGRETAELVQRETTRMVTAGQSAKQMADELVESRLLDPVSNLSPAARAEVIARTETMRVYRQAVHQKAQRAGLVHYRMVGPVTPKTSKVCRSFVGRVLPAEDWKLVMGDRWGAGEHAGRGFHPKCRHLWQPVKPAWLDQQEGDYGRTGAFNTQVAREHDADESLPVFSLRDIRKMPDSERRELFGRSENGIRLVA